MQQPSPAHLSGRAGPMVSVVLGMLLITRTPWMMFLACLPTVHGTAERKGEGSIHLRQQSAFYGPGTVLRISPEQQSLR